jgi:predicted RNA-binding Zn-ribbon protein involved in translation (DUF1610 family)
MQPDAGKKTYYCPRCGEKLSLLDGSMVQLDGLLEAPTFSVRVRLYIPAELGQYGAIVNGPVEIREGARVEFLCISPRCGANLTVPYNHDLAEIRMVDENGRDYAVVFHKTYGQHATFVVDRSARKLTAEYGEHAATYAGSFERALNFFGA